MNDLTYDGLCGIPCPAQLRGGWYLRCHYEMGHETRGHSWSKHLHRLYIHFGLTAAEVARYLNRPPDGCRCVPLREAETGKILDYVFSPSCEVHDRPAPV